MKLMMYLLLFGCLLVTDAAPAPNDFPILHPGGIGGIFKGPDSETIVKGPDGSVITSAQEGGAVLVPETRLQPIVVADNVADLESVISAEQVLSNGIATNEGFGQILDGIGANQILPVSTASAAPIFVTEQPFLVGPAIPGAPVSFAGPIISDEPIKLAAHGEEPHRIDIELVDAPEVESDLAATLVGPSGTITTRGSKSIVSGPASTTISEPVKYVKTAAVATPIFTAPDIRVAPQSIAIASEGPILGTAGVNTLQTSIPVSTIASSANTDIGAISRLSATANIDLGGISVSSTLAPLTNNIDVGAISTLSPYAGGEQTISQNSIGSILPEVNSLGSISSTVNSIGYISSTVAPPTLISSTVSGLNLGEANIGIRNVQADPISSYGFINNENNVALLQGQVGYSSSNELPVVSSTVGPEAGLAVSNLAIPNSQALGGNIQSYLDQGAIDNRQIPLDASDIPSSNIIPPEIGIQGARYLGATFSVSETPIDSSNIQKIARVDNTINIDGRLGGFNSPNELLTGEVLDSRNAIFGSTGNIDITGLSFPPPSNLRVDSNQVGVPQAPGLDSRFSKGDPAVWNGYRTETTY